MDEKAAPVGKYCSGGENFVYFIKKALTSDKFFIKMKIIPPRKGLRNADMSSIMA